MGRSTGRGEDAHRRLPEALDWNDGDGGDGATERFSSDRRSSETRRRPGGFPCSMWGSERTTATWATCSSLSVDGGAPWRAVDGDPASVNSGEPREIGERERGAGAREERRGRARVCGAVGLL